MPAFKKFIPAIIWFFVVLVLICLPGDDLPKPKTWMDEIFFDKWVHIGLFSVLAFLFMFPFTSSDSTHRKKLHVIIKIAVCTSIWGITTEFIQKFFITGRNFDLIDWAADSFGAAIAYLFCWQRYVKSAGKPV